MKVVRTWNVFVSEPRAVATGSSDCGSRISDCGFRAAESSSPQSEVANPQSEDPVATACGSDTRATIYPFLAH